MENDFTMFSSPTRGEIFVKRSAILAVIPTSNDPQKFTLLLGKDFTIPINESLELIQEKIMNAPNPREIPIQRDRS